MVAISTYKRTAHTTVAPHQARTTMVAISRLFNEAVRHKCCNELTHTGGCTSNAIGNLVHFCGSNARYFAPITLLPLLVKLRRLDRRVLSNTLKYYGQCVVSGTATGWVIHIFICIFRHLLGEFHPLTFALVPTAVGGFVGWVIGTPRVRILFEVTLYQCTIESYILKRNFITRSLGDSLTLQTAIFMCCSALILHAKQRGVHRGFWLLVPAAQPTIGCTAPNEETPALCSHNEPTCSAYLLHGFSNYLAIGLTLDIIKMLMRRTPSTASGTLAKLLAKVSNFRLQSATFLTAYVSIYRFTHCYINRRSPAHSTQTLNHLFAGFLAGASYILMPKLTVFTYALVQCMMILYNYFDALPVSKAEPTTWLTKLQMLVKRTPFVAIMYPLLLARLVHVYCLRRSYISNLGAACINGITNKYALHINQKLELAERLMDASAAKRL